MKNFFVAFPEIKQTFFEKKGVKYAFSGAKDGQAADRFLKSDSLEGSKAVILHAFDHPQEFTRKRATGLAQIWAMRNQLAAELANKDKKPDYLANSLAGGLASKFSVANHIADASKMVDPYAPKRRHKTIKYQCENCGSQTAYIFGSEDAGDETAVCKQCSNLAKRIK